MIGNIKQIKIMLLRWFTSYRKFWKDFIYFRGEINKKGNARTVVIQAPDGAGPKI